MYSVRNTFLIYIVIFTGIIASKHAESNTKPDVKDTTAPMQTESKERAKIADAAKIMAIKQVPVFLQA